MSDTYHQIYELPPSLRWNDSPARPFEDLPAEWPTTDRTERILTYNASNRVLVCLPPALIPSTEDSAPLFGSFRLHVHEASVETVETLLEATSTQLGSVGSPDRYWYGVKVGGIQTYGATLDRFKRDLRTVTEWLEGGNEPQLRETAIDAQYVLGAALWPVEGGWAHLTYRRDRRTESESVEFNLLSPGLRVDDDPVATVFEAVGETEPTVQGLWPERWLKIQGRRRHTLVEGKHVGLGSNHPVIHGSNPLYRSSPEELFSDRPPQELVDPLLKTSTLPYHGPPDDEDSVPGLREIIAVEPPGRDALWVTAKSRRAISKPRLEGESSRHARSESSRLPRN